MDTATGLVTSPWNNKTFTTSDAALSRMDCVISSNNDLSKLARQASHQQ